MLISDIDKTAIVQNKKTGGDQYSTVTDKKISEAMANGSEVIFLSTMTIDEIKTAAGEGKILRTELEKKYSNATKKEKSPKIIPATDLFFTSLGEAYLNIFKPLYEKIASKTIDPLKNPKDYKQQIGEPGARDIYHRAAHHVMKKLLSAMSEKKPIFQNEEEKKQFIKTAITDLKNELIEFTPEGTYLTAIENLERFLQKWDPTDEKNYDVFLNAFISELNKTKLVDLTFIKFIQENSPLFLKHQLPLDDEKFLSFMRTIKTYVDKAEDGDTIDIDFLDDKMGCLEEASQAINIIMAATKKNITINFKSTAVLGDAADIHKTYQEITFIPHDEIIKKINSEKELNNILPYLNYLNINSVTEQINTDTIPCVALSQVLKLYKNFQNDPKSINFSKLEDVHSIEYKAFMLLSPTIKLSTLKERLKDPNLDQNDLRFICEYCSKKLPHATFTDFSKTRDFYPHGNFYNFYGALKDESKNGFLNKLLDMVEKDDALKKNDFIQFLLLEADSKNIEQLSPPRKETVIKILLNSENITPDTQSLIINRLFNKLSFDEKLFKNLNETEKNNLFRMMREGPINRLLWRLPVEIGKSISNNENENMYKFINAHLRELSLGSDQKLVSDLAAQFKKVPVQDRQSSALANFRQSILLEGFQEKASKIKSKSATFNALKQSEIDQSFFENYVKCMEESYITLASKS
ncbi:hypothetical protein [Legionella steigerwaltii]|uniref:hypothetical protein n=1 Tax=Legionella steigerwaltii TaxID=460 RepID=UPI0012E3E6FD|nr:hypothetical protein [Legionella steigerwaltii]